ncbi:MAG: HEAT repeat domain-containing protein [Planctomycetes bacterium]|nr:HEAT repeat domain-containing protein [Planctomycetota bacterium]
MSMKMKLTLGGAVLAVTGAVAWVAIGGCSIDPTVAQPYKERDLKAEEIRTMLTGGDFKQKMEAQKQIDKLEPEEKLGLLVTLSNDSDPAVRLIAIKKLRPIEDARAKERLAQMAKEDPNEMVRQQAGK